MDRTDTIGLGVASAAHVLLFAALSANWFAGDPIKLNNAPIEVSIADEVALQSAARKIAEAAPPAPGEIEGPPEEVMPVPDELVAEADPEPAPQPKPAPAPTPAPEPRPREPEPQKPKSAPKKASAPSGKAERSRGSKLKLDLSGLGASNSESTSDGAPASSLGPAQKSALDAEIRRQLKPHWKAPSGPDAEQLRTIVTVKLGRDGSITGSPEVVDTLGVTPSNSPQVRLHQEQAVKAIRLAAPFKLPAQFYSEWSFLRLTFDKRLSQ